MSWLGRASYPCLAQRDPLFLQLLDLSHVHIIDARGGHLPIGLTLFVARHTTDSFIHQVDRFVL